MKRHHQAGAMLRAGGVLSLLLVMLTGVTFAALRSQNNIISGNHLTSASANLQMSKLANGPFASQLIGYDFLDLVSGGDPGPVNGNDLFLTNLGSTHMDVQVSFNPARLINSNNVDLNHTFLVISDKTNEIQYAKHSLASLSTAYTNGTPLPVGLTINRAQTAQVKLRMQLGSQASSSTTQVEIQNIDLIFSGLAL